jgi:hypothetical protein
MVFNPRRQGLSMSRYQARQIRRWEQPTACMLQWSAPASISVSACCSKQNRDRTSKTICQMGKRANGRPIGRFRNQKSEKYGPGRGSCSQRCWEQRGPSDIWKQIVDFCYITFCEGCFRDLDGERHNPDPSVRPHSLPRLYLSSWLAN